MTGSVLTSPRAAKLEVGAKQKVISAAEQVERMVRKSSRESGRQVINPLAVVRAAAVEVMNLQAVEVMNHQRPTLRRKSLTRPCGPGCSRYENAISTLH